MVPPDPETIDGPRILDVLAQRIGYLFAKLHQRWLAESVAVLSEAGLGLSALHFGALSAVKAAGPMSQQVLGEYVKKDRTTIVAIVDELEQMGLVERRRNPSDRRAYALEVTEEGSRWLARAGPLLSAAEDRMLGELDEAEREQLLDLLRRVLFNPPPAT